MRARDFFSELSWNITENGLTFPIFNQDELTNAPLKWLKHLLLVYVGLREIDELYKEIHRFPMTDYGLTQARKICISLLSISQNETILIVLKMIFPNRTMGLPNYRITTLEQIKSTFDSIEFNYLNTVDELWLCNSNTSHSTSNFGGRIAFRLDATWMQDVIEIIWYTSPRMLDEGRLTKFPHLRALRCPGSLSFVIKDLYFPDAFKSERLDQLFLKDYQLALLELNRRKEKIDILADILHRNGANEVILEFKMDSGCFKIIDWDTDIETRMIYQAEF